MDGPNLPLRKHVPLQGVALEHVVLQTVPLLEPIVLLQSVVLRLKYSNP